eukprot:542540-Karenia_brevis.AAC.1
MDGCMFWADALYSEHAPAILAKLAAISGVYQQTEILGTDRPEDWDAPFVFAALPILQCITGDFSHVTFAVASCYGCSFKPGIVTCLRKLGNKWCAEGSPRWLQGQYFRREQATPR